MDKKDSIKKINFTSLVIKDEIKPEIINGNKVRFKKDLTGIYWVKINNNKPFKYSSKSTKKEIIKELNGLL